MSFWSSIWDTLWWFITIFIFIAYLMALFSIITDLFRDRKLNGWAKAVWLIFLMFVPFLTALAYLITRGGGMAERSAAAQQNAEKATDDYIRSVAGASPASEIAQARQLLDSGALTQGEYEQLKQKILAAPYPNQ
ncbi:SHOCT domain-containing protein [Corynebacterium pacaense]|uniref:SHOCT domain-containing protein n=1 Tax=Corynebacterium pacaense TaxID=1816684 RepID=UPI0009B9AF16|nr:SHOCT domain-containing protein [Corynebacterium pacaense]